MIEFGKIRQSWCTPLGTASLCGENKITEPHLLMKFRSRSRIVNRFHNSRKVAKLTPDRIHGIAGTKASARNNSLVSDLESQLGDSQDLGRGPLLAGENEHTDKLGAGEACGTDDVAVSEVRHTAVANSKNSVFRIAFID